jgi:hypothetical protein
VLSRVVLRVNFITFYLVSVVHTFDFRLLKNCTPNHQRSVEGLSRFSGLTLRWDDFEQVMLLGDIRHCEFYKPHNCLKTNVKSGWN